MFIRSMFIRPFIACAMLVPVMCASLTPAQDPDPFGTPAGTQAEVPRIDPQRILATKLSYSAPSDKSTVGTLFETLSQDIPHVNFVVSKNAKRVQLPDFGFENLSLATLFQLLPQITDGRIRVEPEAIPQNSDDENLVVIVAYLETQEPLETRVISVKQLLAGMDQETLMEAFDDGLKFIGSDQKPEIGFHPKTGLLFVRGTPQQTHFLTEMVQAMQGNQVYGGYPGMASPGGYGGMGGGIGGMGGGIIGGSMSGGGGGAMMSGFGPGSMGGMPPGMGATGGGGAPPGFSGGGFSGGPSGGFSGPPGYPGGGFPGSVPPGAPLGAGNPGAGSSEGGGTGDAQIPGGGGGSGSPSKR